jgi:hypothetical protein
VLGDRACKIVPELLLGFRQHLQVQPHGNARFGWALSGNP